MKCISAGRTKKILDLMNKNGGEFKAEYALLGDLDLVLILDMPDIEQAMKIFAALGQIVGRFIQHRPGGICR